MKWLGSYTIPRIDVLVSGTLQNLPGPPIAANYTLTSAVAAQALGRPLSGGAANVVVGLISAGSQYGERLSQVDFRVAKILRYQRTKTMVSLDLFHLTNASTVLATNATFGPVWLKPSSILPARFAKITLQVDF